MAPLVVVVVVPSSVVVVVVSSSLSLSGLAVVHLARRRSRHELPLQRESRGREA